MEYKVIACLDNILKTSQFDQETIDLLSQKLDEMDVIADSIATMKAHPISIFDRSQQWDPQYISSSIKEIIYNLGVNIAKYIQSIGTTMEAQEVDNMNVSINDFGAILFDFEKQLSELPYETVQDVSQALSNIRIIFSDTIKPYIQGAQQESEEQEFVDKGIEEHIKEIDPNLRRFFQRVSIKPLIYEYKGNEIKVRKDKKNRPYFEMGNTGVTSRNLSSLINYIESLGKD